MKGLVKILLAAGLLGVTIAPSIAGDKSDKSRYVLGTVRYVDGRIGYASVYDPSQRLYNVRLSELRHGSGAPVSADTLRSGDRVRVPKGARSY